MDTMTQPIDWWFEIKRLSHAPNRHNWTGDKAKKNWNKMLETFNGLGVQDTFRCLCEFGAGFVEGMLSSVSQFGLGKVAQHIFSAMKAFNDIKEHGFDLIPTTKEQIFEMSRELGRLAYTLRKAKKHARRLQKKLQAAYTRHWQATRPGTRPSGSRPGSRPGPRPGPRPGSKKTGTRTSTSNDNTKLKRTATRSGNGVEKKQSNPQLIVTYRDGFLMQNLSAPADSTEPNRSADRSESDQADDPRASEPAADNEWRQIKALVDFNKKDVSWRAVRSWRDGSAESTLPGGYGKIGFASGRFVITAPDGQIAIGNRHKPQFWYTFPAGTSFRLENERFVVTTEDNDWIERDYVLTAQARLRAGAHHDPPQA
jgi:hypothetical protein